MDFGKIHFGNSINFSGKAGFNTETNKAEMLNPDSKSFLDVLGEHATVQKYGVPAPHRNDEKREELNIVKYGLPYIPSIHDNKEQPPALKYAIPNMDNRDNRNNISKPKEYYDIKPLYAVPMPDSIKEKN